MGQNATKSKTQLKKDCKYNFLIKILFYIFSKPELFRIFVYNWSWGFRQSLESKAKKYQ